MPRVLPFPFPFASKANLVPSTRMNLNALIGGLQQYICLVILLTFHEFAHAWTASKFGDDTARSQGRVSLNPIVHMELIGTVVLPLLAIYLGSTGSSLSGFIIGWGKPVPVDLRNLHNRRLADNVISMAGPAMNLLLALGLMILAKGFEVARLAGMVEFFLLATYISLILCFFNLIPVPPLDGSHVLKNTIRMSETTYWNLCRYGFIIVIIVIQIPLVRAALGGATSGTLYAMARLVHL